MVSFSPARVGVSKSGQRKSYGQSVVPLETVPKTLSCFKTVCHLFPFPRKFPSVSTELQKEALQKYNPTTKQDSHGTFKALCLPFLCLLCIWPTWSHIYLGHVGKCIFLRWVCSICIWVCRRGCHLEKFDLVKGRRATVFEVLDFSNDA